MARFQLDNWRFENSTNRICLEESKATYTKPSIDLICRSSYFDSILR